MKANEVPERYKTCDWLWNYGSIGLKKEHIKRLNNAINILESVYEYTDAKYLKEIKDKLLEDSEIIDPKEVTEFVFPELKESDDERIRKWLIGVIKSNEYGNISNVGEMPCPKPNVIAWLEKQGERKQNVTDIDIISDLENYFATTTKEQQEKDWDEIKNWEKKYFNHNKHIEQKPNFCHHEIDLSNYSEEYRKAYYDGWNNCNQQHAQLEAEQKHAEWSEEDEEIIEGLNNCLDELEEKNGWQYTYVNDKDVKLDKIRNWLQSLKERMKGE